MRALEVERHFALVAGLRFSNLWLAFNRQSRNSVRPSHLFDLNCDHDYLFELPGKGSGMPNHYVGD
jgi:hypothetical protein